MSSADLKTEKKKPTKKRILPIVLLAVLAVILAVVIYAAIQAGQNKEQMNLCADAAIADIGSAYSLTPVDCSEFENLTVYGFMKFQIEQYDVENLGNLCVMRANGGVMQMLTITLTPAKIDMPLFSVDYMYILGNRTAYVEVYDLNIGESQVRENAIENLKSIGAQFSGLTDTTPSSAWYDSLRPAGSYKKVSANEDEALLEMLEQYLNEYLNGAKECELLSEDKIPEKLDAMEAYTHRLIGEGGISTDVFKKELGEEQTRKFFDNVMFGTGNYR
jgi:hypothetical protein